MRRFVLAGAGLLACASAATAPSALHAAAGRHAGAHTAHRHANGKALAFYRREIDRYRRETWYWQRVMGIRRTAPKQRFLAGESAVELRSLGRRWRRRAAAAREHAHHPPQLSAWLCIHRYEGSWKDPGAPYYGGLQMDLSFQQRYGGWLLRSKGTADHWTPLEQIWTAVKARRTRGFYPWPTTARICGLL